MKKFIGILLAVSITLSLFPSSVLHVAANGDNLGNIGSSKAVNSLGFSTNNENPTIDTEPSTRQTYTVVFKDWDGTNISTQQIQQGEAAVAPADPVRPGYGFSGWDGNYNNITSNTIITATFIPLTSYTITVNYVKTDQTMVYPPNISTVISGKSFHEIINSPTINGYQADQSSVEINISSVTEDINRYVYYTPATNTPYKVQHFQQDLTGNTYTLIDTDDLNATTGETITAVSKNYSGFSAPSVMPSAVIAADGSTIIQVRYTRNQYTIYFNSNGGTYIPPITNLFDATITPPANPTRAGYQFTAWSSAIPTKMPANNITLNAQWATQGTVNYSVVHWLENASGTGYDYVGNETKSGTAGAAVTIPTAAPSTITFPIANTHFTINSTKTDNEKPSSISGDGSTILNVYYTRNIYTLRFAFDANKYTLTVGGTTYTTSPYQFSAKLGADISNLWPSSPPTLKPGKNSDGNFTGWTGPIANINYVTRQLTLATNHLVDPTLTASWSTNTKQVTVHYWFQTPDLSGYVENYTQTLSINSTSSSFNAKAFPGFTPEQTPIPITGTDINFRYTRNKYTLSFYNGSTLEQNDPNMLYQASLSPKNYTPLPPSYLQNGYTFAGWYTTQQGYDNSKIDFSTATMPSSNLILYSRWDKQIYTVSFDPDNGQTIPSQTVPYQGNATRPPDPLKTGYTFNGWVLQGQTLNYVFDYPVTQNLSLKASWIANENISYDVVHNIPGQPQIRTTISGKKMNESVTANALVVPGYLPNSLSQSLNLAASGNEIVFNYTAISSSSYKVQYLRAGDNYVLATEKTSTTQANQVTEPYVPVTGYYPDAYQKTLRISQDVNENILIFYYSKNPDVSYTVNHYKENLDGKYSLDSGGTYSAAAGERVAPIPLSSFTGFSFNSLISSPERVIASDGSTVFSYYYDRIKYAVNFVAEPNGSLIGATAFSSLRYGTPFDSTINIPSVLPDPGYLYSWDPSLPSSGSLITENKTYTAKFSQDPSKWTTIFYDSNNGSNIVNPGGKLLIGSETTLVSNPFSYTDHIFLNWNTKSDGSGDTYFDGQTINVPVGDSSNNLTLYAQWLEKDRYVVNYYANGGSGSLVDPDSPYVDGETVTVLNNTFTRPGYSFTGWNSLPSGIFYPDNGTTHSFVMGTEPVSLYAQWNKNSNEWVTIKYDKNNPYASGSISDFEFLLTDPNTLLTSTHTIAANPFTLSNYIFKGWNTTQSPNDPPEYNPGDIYTPSGSGTITLYAQWEEIPKYTISYYENYPGNTDPLATTKYVQGSFYKNTNVFLLGNTLFSRLNYQLVEWNTLPNGTGTTYPLGIDVPSVADLALFAIWDENDFYKVSYEDTLSSQTYSDIQKYYININTGVFEPVTVKPLMFSHAGYDFTGWDVYNGSILALQGVQSGDSITTLTTDAVFKAQWEPISYNISYNLDGGTLAVANPTTYNIESSTFSFNNPTKQGYHFAGWIGTGISSPQTGWSLVQGSIGDKAYTATWVKAPEDWSTIYFVSTDTSKGTLSSITTFEGIKGTTANITVPNTNPAPGYKFDIWDTAIPSTFPPNDTTITAIWAKDSIQWTTIEFVTSNPTFGILTGTTLFDGVIGQPTSNVVIPQPEAMAGYAFSGWTAVVPNNYGSSPLTITANWIKVNENWSTIIFDPGDINMGALSGTTSFTGPKGTSTISVNIPTPVAKPGYSFTGWSTPLPGTFPNSDLLITANWKKEDSLWSTITYDPGNGSMGTATGNLVFEGVKGSSTISVVSEPIATANSGYKFDGWSSAIPEFFPNNNITIFANWSYDPNQWSSILFGISDPTMGTISGTTSYTGIIGSSTSPAVTFPTVLPNPGYTVGLWSSGIPVNYPSQTITIIANLVKDTSKWSTLYFLNNDSTKGDLIGSASLEGLIGTPVNTSSVPLTQPKPGYRFKEWLPNVPSDFPLTNSNIVAFWEEDPSQWSSIDFISSDPSMGELQGTVSYRGVKGQDSSYVQFPTLVPKPGYQFKEWSIATLPGQFPQSNLLIQASWEQIPNGWSSITFVTGDATKGNLSGILFFSGPKGQPVPSGIEPNKIPVSGYQFKQWDQGMPTVFPPSDVVVTAEWDILPAGWSSVLFTSGVNPKGTLTGTTMFSGVKLGNTPTIIAPTPNPFPGYDFDVWDDIVPTSYPNTNMVINATWKKDTNQWSKITFVSDQPNQGTLLGTYQYEGIINSSASGVVLPTPQPKVGYTFSGWETTSIPDWKLSDLGGVFPPIDLIVTAKWSKNPTDWSNISFISEDIQKGILSGQSLFEGIKNTPLPAFARVPGTIPALGYQFSGWSILGNSNWTSADMPVNYPSSNLLVTAHWEKDSDAWSKIKFVSADPLQGTISGNLEYDGVKSTSTSGIVLPTTNAKPGYRFSHWSSVVPITYPSQDLTVYAYWIKDIDQWSTIRFESDPLNGTLQGILSFEGIIGTSSSNIILPTPLPLDGYKFVGWDTSVPPVYPNQNIVIRAQWSNTKQIQSSIRFVNADPSAGSFSGTTIFQGDAGDTTSGVVAPIAIANSGYTFAGWDSEIPSTYPSNILVITGSWNKTSTTQGNDSSGGSSTPDKPTPLTPSKSSPPSSIPSSSVSEPVPQIKLPPTQKSTNPSQSSIATEQSNSNSSVVDNSSQESSNEAPSKLPSDSKNQQVSVSDGNTALPTEKNWVLINYTILLASVIMIIGNIILLRKKQTSDKSKNEHKERKFGILSLISGAALIISFIITIQVGSNMILFDKWTPLLLVIGTFQGLMLYLASKQLKD